jgi:hypothetical protein
MAAPKPILYTENSTHLKERRVIDTVLKLREAKGEPFMYECITQLDLSFGQATMLQNKQITLVMEDDLGKYELVPGPDRRVVKRRL